VIFVKATLLKSGGEASTKNRPVDTGKLMFTGLKHSFKKTWRLRRKTAATNAVAESTLFCSKRNTQLIQQKLDAIREPL
jgi:hypothetical protein